MHKTTLLVDDALIEQAANVLGTSGIKDTIDAALKAIVVGHVRKHLVENHIRAMDPEVAKRLEDIELADIEGRDWHQMLAT